MTKLSSIADYVTDKISSNDIALREYVTTDCAYYKTKKDGKLQPIFRHSLVVSLAINMAMY